MPEMTARSHVFEVKNTENTIEEKFSFTCTEESAYCDHFGPEQK